MPPWYRTVDLSELPEGSMKAVEAGGTRVLLVHGASGVRAFENRCGHMAAPLSLGTFKSGVLKCALHASVFDAATGEIRGPPQYHRGGTEQLPPPVAQALARVAEIQDQVETRPLVPFPVGIDAGVVHVFL